STRISARFRLSDLNRTAEDGDRWRGRAGRRPGWRWRHQGPGESPAPKIFSTRSPNLAPPDLNSLEYRRRPAEFSDQLLGRALGERRDREERVDPERGWDDRAVGDAEAVVDP